jgi:hypothetical protein
MGRLEQFHDARAQPLQQNALLRSWLFDDRERAAFYGELGAAGWPVLRFKSVLGSAGDPGWPATDVYLVSQADQVSLALREFSVDPYTALESGGKFLLGIDDPPAHRRQRDAVEQALRIDAADMRALAAEAIRRASILPLGQRDFNLPTDLAEEAALRFAELLFGLRHLAHRYLRPFMRAAYTRLVFQIVGRHFVADAGLPPRDAPKARELVDHMRAEVRRSRRLDAEEMRVRRERGLPPTSVIASLYAHGGLDDETVVDVAIGLIAGMIGNVMAAVTIVIDDFFERPADGQPWRIDAARSAAAKGDDPALQAQIDEVLLRKPPAPFLARKSRLSALRWRDEAGAEQTLPADVLVLIAVGADPRPEHVFGGDTSPPFMHQCVGRYLARMLTLALVRQILRLPGLRPGRDAHSGDGPPLQKRWGTACERYLLEYRRDRRLNQQPLHVVLPLKQPYAESAAALQALTKGGAFIVQDALDKAKHVHFAWFALVENGTHLAMMTTYDGDFDAYVEHFATDVELFDEQLKYLEGAPEPPVRENAKAFVEWIRKHNRAPMGGYFYSAYPLATAARIDHAFDPGSST